MSRQTRRYLFSGLAAAAVALALTSLAVRREVSSSRSVDAGAPRPWEAGLQVARHSTVNLFNGNNLTVIPIFAAGPIGPALTFNLYHNSASALSSQTYQAGWGCAPHAIPKRR